MNMQDMTLALEVMEEDRLEVGLNIIKVKDNILINNIKIMTSNIYKAIDVAKKVIQTIIT